MISKVIPWIFAISIITIMSIFLFGCSSDGDDSNIDPLLEPYFELFKTEAAERGISIDYDSLGISGVLTTLDQGGVIGQCRFLTTGENVVTFDRFFFSGFSEFEREHVVFHELGHCVLNRGHLDAINNDGTCFSIMASSVQLCDTNYNDETREDYIDELFNI